MSQPQLPVRRALISVSNKMGLNGFARALSQLGVEILSTGGTARHLAEFEIPVTDVSSYTQFPEMMDGRVKTLHPKIFGGILCRRDREDDLHSAEAHGILPIDLVVVNLYPFQSTVAREGVTSAEAIEQIDIGGPSLVRAAAKNHQFVAIATSPDQYSSILQELTENGGTTFGLRQQLASAAFAHTADYDRAIADYFANDLNDDNRSSESPSTLRLTLRRKSTLRYGENPHQSAAVYSDPQYRGANLLSARQLNGKELSYNNLLDLDSALSIVSRFDQPAAVVIKHNNPCGAAAADTLSSAISNAMAGDPVSAFGSILAFNRSVDLATAEVLAEPGLFVEAIVAPAFEQAALELLTTRPKWKSNVRLMELGDIQVDSSCIELRQVSGGMLVQSRDQITDDDWKVVTDVALDDGLQRELKFAWEIVRHIKSNAIAICRDQSLVGAGAGQMSRVDSVEIAINKAGERTQGAVLSSDAFFPFPDSIHKAAEAGIAAIIQPGGSKKDPDVIAACNECGIPMVFTGNRHFKH